MSTLPPIIILGNKSKNNISKYVWLDAFKQPNVTYIPEINKNNLFRLIYRLLFNRRILRFIPILRQLKNIVNHSFYANLIVNNIPKEKSIVISNISAFYKLHIFGFIEKHKRKYQSTIILFLYDTFSKLPQEQTSTILSGIKSGTIDKVYSFDPSDCSQYGFTYIAQCYSPARVIQTNETRYDIYFAGRNKGRISTLASFLKAASSHQLTSFFRIPELKSGEKQEVVKCPPTSFKEDMLSYEDILQEMQYANCILEIVQEGQNGISWRAVEAFVFNKKLLTNNENIKTSPFYNPNYIHIFKNIEDIDFNWIKEQIPISYNYHNEYSPLCFIKKVQQDLGYDIQK